MADSPNVVLSLSFRNFATVGLMVLGIIGLIGLGAAIFGGARNANG